MLAGRPVPIHPRTCGVYEVLPMPSTLRSDPSPHLRGLPPLCGPSSDARRSIPAPAGSTTPRSSRPTCLRSIPAPAGSTLPDQHRYPSASRFCTESLAVTPPTLYPETVSDTGTMTRAPIILRAKKGKHLSRPGLRSAGSSELHHALSGAGRFTLYRTNRGAGDEGHRSS